eukprot:TRINITY_DN79909_c0_g1_i1.p1 TRINITY_DN79909_c0_g1~~TRINITY_DN79909_c0_g1_i1.p1  ORF type:complete len:428 (-),score=99.33 TRINITY_DN79909_c0_g1_i1:4-1287(-)
MAADGCSLDGLVPKKWKPVAGDEFRPELTPDASTIGKASQRPVFSYAGDTSWVGSVQGGLSAADGAGAPSHSWSSPRSRGTLPITSPGQLPVPAPATVNDEDQLFMLELRLQEAELISRQEAQTLRLECQALIKRMEELQAQNDLQLKFSNSQLRRQHLQRKLFLLLQQYAAFEQMQKEQQQEQHQKQKQHQRENQRLHQKQKVQEQAIAWIQQQMLAEMPSREPSTPETQPPAGRPAHQWLPSPIPVDVIKEQVPLVALQETCDSCPSTDNHCSFRKQSEAITSCLEVRRAVSCQELAELITGGCPAVQCADGELGTGDAETLAKALQSQAAKRRLEVLLLGSNELGAEGSHIVSSALPNCSRLQHLDLSWNQLGPAGGRALAAVLGGQLQLRRLELSSNKLVAEGARALAEVLAKDRSLEHLDLS